MARTKTYNTKEIIGLLNEYNIENPGVKVTIPKFGTYIRSKGYDIKDHTLRRDEKFRECLNELNKEDDAKSLNDLVTYKTVDAEAFITKNNTKAKLKESITNRDNYYASIAANAVKAIQDRNESLERIKELECEINEFKETIKELETKLQNEKSKVKEANTKEKDNTILTLKRILDDYVYPDMANAILKKEGILEVVNSLVSDDIVDKNTMRADSSIKEELEEEKNSAPKSKFASVDSILGGFDD